ncbi:MAG TPA: amino acid adenylation domain-containing protein, partial [Polyangium sp.]|nr:amino acid adenylation domain-containing protein [Polyangium sp.]
MKNYRRQQPNFRHLIELLNTRAADLGDTPLYRYLETGDIHGCTIVWGYAELDHRARAIAARLQDLNAFGERIVLLYAPGLEFIAAFFGCLYAGAIAVPAYPPDPTRLSRTLPRLRAIAMDARARFVLTTADIVGFAEVIGPQAPELAAMHWMATDDVNVRDGAHWSRPNIDAESIAFLQYTSGSTGHPKGVMVRHRNLMHNSEVIAAGFEHDERCLGVGWLPMFHDMGLIGNVLQPLFVGFPCVLMSPLAFLQRPARWLEAISHFRATTSGGPNFAYDLCARRVSPAQIESLDLRSWNVAFSGAEPIRNETLVRFADVFAPAGFRAQAYYCCYGLAEATLLVTGASKSEPPCTISVDAEALEHGFAETNTVDHQVRSLVSSGRPGVGMRVEIVDPNTLRPCGFGSIGEIWVAGASVAAGYWNQSSENEITFHAHLADTGEGPFLRTGDLGFVRDGQLFVTGRRKDLLIIAGRNHYPHDIERAVEGAHRLVRAGCCAAFSLEVEAEERLGIAAEIQAVDGAEIDTVVAAIRHAVLEEFGVYAHAVVLLAPRSIPKTSSGKIQRSACREAFLSGTLDEVKRSIADTDAVLFAGASEETPTELQNVLADVFADVLGLSHIGMHDSLFSLGLQSLLATQTVSRLRDVLGVDITLRMLFDAPTVADLARAVEPFMHPGSRVLLPTIPLVPRSQPLPLSFSQERLWFLDRFDPDSVLYTIPAALRLFGSLDTVALERSFQEILTRHEALRATFHQIDGQPYQVIAPTSKFDLPVIPMDASRIQACIAEEVRRPFDLTRGPLMRAMLYRLSEREHVLLLVMHHIVSDGWSMNVFVREISTLYRAFCGGKPSPLPALPVQYADYAAWQRQWLTGKTLERQIEYWKERLAGAPAAIELPTDKPRPPGQSHRGASIPLALPRDLSNALVRLGQSEGATLFMTLLGAFAILLSRYTGQDDIVIGSPIANRTRPEVEGLIGFFVNTLALRIQLSRQSTFRTLLAQIREETLGAYAHQDTPFEKLVDELAPVRDPSRAPIFQVMFVLQDDPAARISLPGLDVRQEWVDSGTAKFDLTMLLHETSEGLRGTIDYSTDIFAGPTVERLAGHFEVLLRGIVDGPDSSIARLPVLTESERHQLLVEWNDTRVEVPTDKCVHELFEEQAAKIPDAVAVIFEDQQLTYADLNTRANQLAQYLRTLHLGPEVFVGLCVDRSIEMLVGILGILKAGGAYVPIDPTHPKERIARILADAGVSVILTQSHVQSTLPLSGARVVSLDMDIAQWEDRPDLSPKSEVHLDNAAYVIYTSGSTGKPKGVLVSHAGLPNLAHSRKRRHHLRLGQKALVFASFAFDSFVADLWGAWVSGACAVIPTERERTDMAALERLLARVNAAVLPPAILPGLSPSALSTNLMLGVAGDVCPAHEVHRWTAGRNLSNLYGPTEVTVETLTYDAPEDSREAMPIGRPVENTHVFVVDDLGMLQPVGIPGEFCISGVGLARGYMNQPAMTAERFVPNPFGPPGSRMYRTGDLARWRADGNLEFLGRIDHQVKIRGF